MHEGHSKVSQGSAVHKITTNKKLSHYHLFVPPVVIPAIRSSVAHWGAPSCPSLRTGNRELNDNFQQAVCLRQVLCFSFMYSLISHFYPLPLYPLKLSLPEHSLSAAPCRMAPAKLVRKWQCDQTWGEVRVREGGRQREGGRELVANPSTYFFPLFFFLLYLHRGLLMFMFVPKAAHTAEIIQV